MSEVSVEPHAVRPYPFIFHSGQSVSDPLDVNGWNPVALQIPAIWTSANITFLAAESYNGTYGSVFGPTGTEAMATVGATGIVVLLASTTLADIRGLRFIKLRSGTQGLPVTQAADRTVNMLVQQGA
jgi:hypothetical protein